MSDSEGNINFSAIKLPEGGILKRKELYQYTSPHNVYNIELFENQDGSYYAIGVPQEGQRLVVYGTNETKSRQMALQILIDKIRREGVETLFGDDAGGNAID
jgi:hypothetical protein